MRSAVLLAFLVFSYGVAVCQVIRSAPRNSQQLQSTTSSRQEDVNAVEMQLPNRCEYILLFKVRNQDPKILKPVQVGARTMPVLQTPAPCSERAERSRETSYGD